MRARCGPAAPMFLCGSRPAQHWDGGVAGGARALRHPDVRDQRRDPGHYYTSCRASEASPNITMDDGCDLVTVMHKMTKILPPERLRRHGRDLDGRPRLRAMAATKLKFPVIAISDADTKHLFDNRYGDGPEHARRRAARHEHAGRGLDGRHRRLRLVRPMVSRAREGMGATVMVTESIRSARSKRRWTASRARWKGRPEGDPVHHVTGSKVGHPQRCAAMKDGASSATQATSTSARASRRFERMAVSKRQARVRGRVQQAQRVASASACWARPPHQPGVGREYPCVMDISFMNRALSVIA